MAQQIHFADLEERFADLVMEVTDKNSDKHLHQHGYVYGILLC